MVFLSFCLLVVVFLVGVLVDARLSYFQTHEHHQNTKMRFWFLYVSFLGLCGPAPIGVAASSSTRDRWVGFAWPF